jgi:hypothetical protein
MRGLLSALWSFLHHPAASFEETVAGAEHRLEEDVGRAIRARVADIRARLEPVKSRIVEELKGVRSLTVIVDG